MVRRRRTKKVLLCSSAPEFLPKLKATKPPLPTTLEIAPLNRCAAHCTQPRTLAPLTHARVSSHVCGRRSLTDQTWCALASLFENWLAAAEFPSSPAKSSAAGVRTCCKINGTSVLCTRSLLSTNCIALMPWQSDSHAQATSLNGNKGHPSSLTFLSYNHTSHTLSYLGSPPSFAASSFAAISETHSLC